MKTLLRSTVRHCCYASLIGLLAVTAQGATINGYFTNPRVYNDMPGSTLNITPAAPIGVNPATININDQFVGSGANRHDIMVSGDGGLTAYNHGIDDSFTFSTRLTLTAGFNTPRKEAGIRINSPITGDALFIINSDAGEIVAFGGGAPFHIFGNNGGGNGYTPGTSILMGIRHIAGGDGMGGIPNTLEYFIDRGAGIESSGPLAWSNLESGPLNFQVGIYLQGANNAQAGDFMNGLFTDTYYTSVVPEPATFTLVGLGFVGLVAMRRKR
jgi:hypothetical protein